MLVEPFGPSAKGPVRKLVLGAEPGPVLELLDLGATVHRLWVTGGDGVRRNVVLGHATADEYLDSTDYVGATIGRYANRIHGGQFVLDGKAVQLATNERGNQLHGGPDGFDRRIWEVAAHSSERVSLKLVSPAGDQGFPGTLVAQARFEVTENSVRVTLEATTDAATVVGAHQPRLLQPRRGRLGSGRRPVPAGRRRGVPARRRQRHPPRPAAGRRHGVRPAAPRPSGRQDRGGRLRPQLRALRSPRSHPAATLASERTQTRMDLLTDQPGLQVYTGLAFDGSRSSTTGRAVPEGRRGRARGAAVPGHAEPAGVRLGRAAGPGRPGARGSSGGSVR